MKKVLLLLANGFEAFEASVFADVIGWNKLEGDLNTELLTTGLHEEIKSTVGFAVKRELRISEINVDEFDALAIPGGFEEKGYYDDAFHEDFLNLINKFHESNKIIASICVGALPIAKSGILKNKNATTYGIGQSTRQKQLSDFGVNVIPNQSMVVDGNIITGYNPSASFEVAFYLLELLTSKDNCSKIKALMGFKNNWGD